MTTGQIWYRAEFLKSEFWKDARLQALVDNRCECFICGHRDQSNDVHHVWYNHPHHIDDGQLVVLCRICHDLVHEYLSPRTCRSEEEQARIRLQFEKEARKIRWSLFGNPCRGCGALTKRIMDIQSWSPSARSGAMSLCEDCERHLRLCLVGLTTNTSYYWRHAKACLDSLKQKSEADLC